jgi:hypothetical protein
MAHGHVRCGCGPICPGISDRSLAGWLWRLGRCARQDLSRYKMVLLQVHFNARESDAHAGSIGFLPWQDSLRGILAGKLWAQYLRMSQSVTIPTNARSRSN